MSHNFEFKCDKNMTSHVTNVTFFWIWRHSYFFPPVKCLLKKRTDFGWSHLFTSIVSDGKSTWWTSSVFVVWIFFPDSQTTTTTTTTTTTLPNKITAKADVRDQKSIYKCSSHPFPPDQIHNCKKANTVKPQCHR